MNISKRNIACFEINHTINDWLIDNIPDSGVIAATENKPSCFISANWFYRAYMLNNCLLALSRFNIQEPYSSIDWCNRNVLSTIIERHSTCIFAATMANLNRNDRLKYSNRKAAIVTTGSF